MYTQWYQPLVVSGDENPGAALSNSTALTSLLSGADKYSLPPNFLQPGQVGSKLVMKASGILSTPASNTATLTFAALFGTTSVFSSGASAALPSSLTNAPWEIEVTLQCKTSGSGTAATIFGKARLIIGSTVQELGMTVGSGFDSTATQQVDLQAQWSAASASLSIQKLSYELDSPN